MANISIKKDFVDGEKLFAQQLNNNFDTIEKGVNAGNKIIWKDDNGAEIQSFRGTTAEVAERPIIDGQTLYNIETGETALDVGDKRISTGAGNVVYIGDEEPQNDATKIWIENDRVLNLGSEVAISSEEPITQEKVWIQRSRNLFDKNNIILNKYLNNDSSENTSSVSSISNFCKVKENTKYTINYGNIINYYKVVHFYDSSKTFLSYFTITDDKSITTIETPSNCEYLRFHFHTENVDVIQLEQGSVATSYEPYTPKKIHTKTDNGYEEFYSEENREVYSTEEQRIGTWIDGKPLYRRVLGVPETNINSSSITIINFNLDSNVDVKKMNGFLKTQTSNYGFNLSYNGVCDGFRMRLFNNTVQILASEDVAAEKKITSGNIIVEYTKITD